MKNKYNKLQEKNITQNIVTKFKLKHLSKNPVLELHYTPNIAPVNRQFHKN